VVSDIRRLVQTPADNFRSHPPSRHRAVHWLFLPTGHRDALTRRFESAPGALGQLPSPASSLTPVKSENAFWPNTHAIVWALFRAVHSSRPRPSPALQNAQAAAAVLVSASLLGPKSLPGREGENSYRVLPSGLWAPSSDPAKPRLRLPVSIILAGGPFLDHIPRGSSPDMPDRIIAATALSGAFLSCPRTDYSFAETVARAVGHLVNRSTGMATGRRGICIFCSPKWRPRGERRYLPSRSSDEQVWFDHARRQNGRASPADYQSITSSLYPFRRYKPGPSSVSTNGFSCLTVSSIGTVTLHLHGPWRVTQKHTSPPMGCFLASPL